MRHTISLTPSPQAWLRLAAALVVGSLLVLAPLAGRANAGAGDFPSPLYLSGTGSDVVTDSFTLNGAAGPGAPTAAPTVAVLAGGSMPAPGSYTYLYTYVDAGGETPPSPVSGAANTTTGNQQVLVTLPGGLPAGVTVRLYRKSGTALFYHLTDVPSSTTSITDDAPEPPSSIQPPQAQNRVGYNGFSCNTLNCGYADFLPGTPVVNVPAPPSSQTSPNALTATASTAPTNNGWLVDVPGQVSFAAGTWTFRVQTKSGVSTSGTARLVVGLWKVTVSGGAISSSTLLVDPDTAGEQTTTNLRNTTNAVQTVTHSVTLPVVSLAAGEYLYVQFWRRQTTPYFTSNTDARVITLYAYDGVGGFEHPDADDAAPNPFSITSPAGGTFINDGYSLQSNPSDPTPGSGLSSVEYFYCLPLADCSFVPNRISIGSSAASPYSVAWSGQPADGAYQLVARATDNVGNVTDTAVVPVTVDNTAPDTSIGATPPNPSSAAASFGFSSGEAGTFECRVDAAAFALCSSPHTPSGLTSGSHTFEVRAVDQAGNVDATPASYTWTVDAVSPTVTFSSTPASPSASAAASFSFSASEPSTLQCRLDGAAFAACSSPHSLSGLGDGSHTFEVRATDAVGNVGSATHTWSVDTTPPRVTFSSGPANPTNSNGASFAFSTDEAATLECRLDGAGYAACSSPQAFGGLGDGGHTFDVRATDAVGNVGTGSYSWTVDTVAPSAPVPESPVGRATGSLRLTVVYAGPDASATMEFRVCSDAACANVLAAGFSATVVRGAGATWTISPGLADGTYFWQARAIDAAGNASPWTAVTSFARDTVAPGTPGGFVGVVARDGLTLRWTPPLGGADVGNYVVYVNGRQWRVLGEVTYEAKLGPFDAGDTRTFAVSAVDRAGNEGPRTTPLVGVPDVVGLPLPQAKDAVATRGLVLHELRTVQGEGSVAHVVAQTPAAPALAPKGSAIEIVLGDLAAPDNRPLVQIWRGRVCGPKGLLQLQVRLRARANVTVRFLNARGRSLAVRRLGSLPPGVTNRNLRLPKVRPGRYRLVVTAKAADRSGRATIRLTIKKRPAGRTGTQQSRC